MQAQGGGGVQPVHRSGAHEASGSPYLSRVHIFQLLKIKIVEHKCIVVYFMVLMSLPNCGRGPQNFSCSGT